MWIWLLFCRTTSRNPSVSLRLEYVMNWKEWLLNLLMQIQLWESFSTCNLAAVPTFNYCRSSNLKANAFKAVSMFFTEFPSYSKWVCSYISYNKWEPVWAATLKVNVCKITRLLPEECNQTSPCRLNRLNRQHRDLVMTQTWALAPTQVTEHW